MSSKNIFQHQYTDDFIVIEIKKQQNAAVCLNFKLKKERILNSLS